MSETIDNRVVQMEFDNKNFEQGVAVSLKTLDKLKKALELDKAVDSLQRVDQAINKFDSTGISKISQSLTNLEARFSAMGTLGARVLENLADKAVQMSTRMLQSIFIAPVSQGMGKYDEMMNSKQTMKAALGEEKMGDINESLAALQRYSDETSYSFTTMTGALANFVSAGQKDLPKTTKSITGIANAAAKAGIGISKATPAFNAFSKAIGAGKMTLMQWQSLELMNFTTEEFRKRMIEAGIAEGTLKKGKNGKVMAGKKEVTAANMRDTLSQGWATSAVMQRVLNQYADDQVAYNAAQNAKSFQDVWDAVMDAVSSSWMETYRLIFGDLDEAITFFTDLANGLYDWVDVFNSRRNQIISDWRGNGPEKPVLQSTLKIKEGMEQLDGYIEEHAESFKTSFKRDGETIEQYYKDGKYWQRKTSGKGKKKKVVTEEITPDQLGETYFRDGKQYRKVQFEYDTDEEGKPLRKGKKRIETREIEITTDPRSVAELQAELEGIEDGRTYLINGFAQMGSVVIDITERIDKSFGKVFGDNLGSKLLDMSRDFSEFGDSVSEYFNPLRLSRIENVANAFFSVLDWGRAIISALLSPIKSLAVAFAPVMDAFLYLSSAISTVIWRWHDDGKGFEQIASWGERLTAAFSPITDLFGKIAAKIRSVADTVVNKTMNGEDSLGRFGKILDGIGAAGNIAVTVISWLANGFSNLVVFLAPIAGAIGDAALSVLAGIGQALSWLNASGKVPEFLGKVTEKLKNLGGSLVKWFSETTIGKKLSSLKSKISGFFSILKVDPEKAWGVLKRFGKDTKQALIKAAGPIAKVGSNVAQWFGNTALGKKLGKFKNTIGTVWNAFKKDPKRTMEVLKNWGVAYKKKFLDAVNNNPVLKAVREKVGGFFQTIKEKAPQAWENLKRTATSIKDSIVQSEGFQRVKGAVSGFFDRVKEGIQNFDIKEFPGKVRSWLGGIKEQFEKSAVGQWIISKWNWLKEKLGGLLEKFGLNEKLENIKKSLLDFKDRLGIVFDGIGDKMNTFFTLLREDPGAAMQYLKDIFAPITEPIETAFTNLKEWFKTKKEELLAVFKNFFSGNKEAETAEEEGEDDWISRIKGFLTGLVQGIIDPMGYIGSKISTVTKIIGALVGGSTLFMTLLTVWNSNKLIRSVSDTINKHILKKKGLFEGIADTLMSFAQALVMIAGALLVVSLIPQDALMRSVIVLGGSMVLMVGLAALISKFKLDGAIKSIKSFGVGILAMAAAIMVLALAVKFIATFEKEEFERGLKGLGILLGGMLGAMVLFSWLTSKSQGIQGKWKPILAFAAAAFILALSVKLLATMPWDQMLIAIGGLALILGAMVGITFLIAKVPIDTKQIVPYVLFAVIVFALSNILKGLAQIPWDQMLVGVLGMAAIVVALIGVSVAANLGKNSVKPTLMISYILFAVAMWGLADVVNKIGKMDPDALKQGILGMLGIIVGLGVLSVVSKHAKITGALTIALIAGVLIIALHAFVMVSKEAKGIDAGQMVTLLLGLTVAIVALGVIASVIGAGAGAAFAGFVVIAAGILLVGAAVAVVGKLISNSLISFSQAMFVFGSCMGSYSDMIADTDQAAMDASLTFLANFVDTAIYVAQNSRLISMMEDFGNVMYMLGADISLYDTMVNGINVESMNASLQFAKDFADSSTVFVGKDYTGINDLGTALRNFGANMRLFSRMTTKLDLSGITSMQTLADELNSVYTKLSGVTDIGDLSTAIANIGAAIRLYYQETSGIETDGEVDLSNLSTIFTELAAAMPDQTAISDISAYAAGGDNDLTNFALGMTAIGTAFKDLGDNVSTISQATVTKITDILGKLSELRTAITPETVSLDFAGILHAEYTKNGEGSDPLGQFATDITTLGSALGDFGTSLSGAAGENGDFANFDKGIEVLTKVKDLNKALSEKDSGFSLDFLGVFNNRKSQLGEFAEDIELLGGGIKKYVDSVKDIDVGKMLASFGALSFFTILHKNMDNIGGVFSWLAGEKNLGVFGAQISTLGDGLAQYMDKISGKTFDNAAASVAPLSELAKIQNTIQSTGGLGDLINGVKDLGAFGTDIGNIGEGLGKFADGISGKTDVLSESEKALTPIDALVDVQNKLPNGAGNLFSMFGSLTDFAGHFEAVGSGLGKFADGIKGKDFSNSLAASQLLSRLGKVQNELYKPNRSLTDFGNDLNVLGPALGVVIDAFAKGVTNREDVMALLNDISAFEQGLTTNNWGLDTFGERLESFGTHLMNFMTDTADFSYEKVSDTIRVLRNLVNLSGLAQKNSAKDGAKAIREMLGVFNDTSWGKQTVATMAAQTATDFITSFNSSVEQLQNGTGEVTIPTLRVRPVLDTSGIETGVGEVNGLLGGIDTSALSLQISAIMEADATNNQNIITRLDLANSYLASIINDNGTHTTTLGNDIQDVYRQIGDLATAMTSLKIWLDSNTLIGYLYSGIDRAIGEDMTP